MMDISDDRFVDDQIRKSVSDNVPPAVERRLRSQLADFRSRLSTPEPVVAPTTRAIGPARRVVGAWRDLCRSHGSRGGGRAGPQAANQLCRGDDRRAQQPWVHLRSVNPGEREVKSGFHPPRNISASRSARFHRV